MSRLVSEIEFHDLQAGERARCIDAGRHPLRFEDSDYLGHAPWVPFAMGRLGPVAGRRVLDYGCGHGMAAVVLARMGAEVTAFDLSGGYAREAARRAAANGVRVRVVRADGEHLPFAAGSFDAVWGNAVLHHLDPGAAGRELARVLRPGGVAVFCEPWGGNPLLNTARRHLPYPGKHRTADERPLGPGDIAALRRHFPGIRADGFQLLGALGRVAPAASRFLRLDAIDRRMLRAFPAARGWCRYVVLSLPRP